MSLRVYIFPPLNFKLPGLWVVSSCSVNYTTSFKTKSQEGVQGGCSRLEASPDLTDGLAACLLLARPSCLGGHGFKWLRPFRDRLEAQSPTTFAEREATGSFRCPQRRVRGLERMGASKAGAAVQSEEKTSSRHRAPR